MDCGAGIVRTVSTASTVSAAWNSLRDELAHWRDVGRRAQFWWRDDDAARWTPALERLVGLAGTMQVPLALAVIPQSADAALFEQLADEVCVLQHGVDHRNRAAPGERRAEFTPAEPLEDAAARIAAGRRRLAGLAGSRWLDVFAPPWNRLPQALCAQLPAAGLHGLSSFGPRAQASPAPGLTQVNTHVDLVNWRGDRGFVGAPAALEQAVRHLAARRRGAADRDEATGWLTHHLQHDAAAWDFMTTLLERTRPDPCVHWVSARTLFAAGTP